MVGDIRGKGLMAALELVNDRASQQPLMLHEPPAQELIRAARQEGAIIRIQGNRLILAALVFTREHVDAMATIPHGLRLRSRPCPESRILPDEPTHRRSPMKQALIP